MITIKVGKKRIKVFNLLFLILILILSIYVLFSLIFLLPIFNSNYSYSENNSNYEIKNKVSFNHRWFNCYITENISVKSDDKLVFNSYTNDLLNSGYKKTKKKTYKKTIKEFGFCKRKKELYEEVHKDTYSLFTLNGNKSETIEYKTKFEDPYVTAKISGREVKEIDIVSNYNENKLGTYVIAYSMDVDKYYKKRLYRIVKVVDKKEPIINLNGDDVVTVSFGKKYIEPGFTAIDDYDGDITNKVKISNKVDNKKPGTYEVTYSVTDSSNNKSTLKRKVIIKEEQEVSKIEPIIEKRGGITYINNILIVNKDYSLPKDYDPKINKEAYEALKLMQKDAAVLGLDLELVSGYRSYSKQESLYKKYVKKDGEKKANTYSAKPGHSEHQTGLAFDIGSVSDSFKNTSEAKWIEQNAHLYGFIVRYPKDKTDITGYIYEPWHVRYLGVEVATKISQSNLTLEEYLGIK